jgi:hypothetical protein
MAISLYSLYLYKLPRKEHMAKIGITPEPNEDKTAVTRAGTNAKSSSQNMLTIRCALSHTGRQNEN